MSTVLITGSSRGLGLGLVKYFLKQANPPRLIIATCRTPETAKELKEIAKNDSRVVVIQLDVTKYDSFPDVYKKVDALVGERGLNVLIHNAAIFPRKFVGLNEDSIAEEVRETFKTNAEGPVFLTQALLPLLKKAAAANKDKPMGISRTAMIFMGSWEGSVPPNTFRRFEAYRESKEALHMSARTFANELKPENILVCVFHPGCVQTDMANINPNMRPPLTVHQSVSGMMDVMYSLDESKHNKFIQWDGKELLW